MVMLQYYLHHYFRGVDMKLSVNIQSRLKAKKINLYTVRVYQQTQTVRRVR